MNWMTILIIFLSNRILKNTFAICEKETFTAGQYVNSAIWESTNSSDVYISSNCLDENMLLVFRRCFNDQWEPNQAETQLRCHLIMDNFTPPLCPAGYGTIQNPNNTDVYFCTTHSYNIGDSCHIQSISYLDLSDYVKDEIYEMINIEHKNHIPRRISARHMSPNVAINSDIEEVQLQETQCGRYGLPIKLDGNTLPVNCAHGDDCSGMCLVIDFNSEKPGRIDFQKCTGVGLNIFTSSFLFEFGCPSGYFRLVYYEINFGKTISRLECFAIKLFDKPMSIIDIENEGSAIINENCNGKIMPIIHIDDVFIFIQLSKMIGLADGDNCLFGLKTNSIVSYHDWENTGFDGTVYWDKNLNYSRILDGNMSYLTSKPNGQWTWEFDSVSCIACTVNDSILEPELKLTFNSLERRLELNLKNPQFLIRAIDGDDGFICFAIISGIYKAKLRVFELDESGSEYLVEDVGYGQYWCSGHSLNSVTLKSTARVDAFGIIFSFGLGGYSENRSNSDYILAKIKELVNFDNFLNIEGFQLITEPISSLSQAITVHLSLSLKYQIFYRNALFNMTDRQFETSYIYETVIENIQDNQNEEIHILSIKSTEFCLQSLDSIDSIIWGVAAINENISVSVLCSSDLHQLCIGDTLIGGEWSEIINVQDCYSNISILLFNLYIHFSAANETTVVIRDLKNLIDTDDGALFPIDVFITSRIIQKISSFVNETHLNSTDLHEMFIIYNRFITANVETLRISAQFNSTNIILDAIETILIHHIETTIVKDNEYLNQGYAYIRSPMLIAFFIDPIVSKFSGIALMRNEIQSDDFTNFSFRFVYPNETLYDLMAEKNLVIGSYIPMETMNVVKNTILITAFVNDNLFQSDVASNYKTMRKVIALTLLDSKFNNVELPGKIAIFFESTEYPDDSLICSYWNFTLMEGWNSDGCTFKDHLSNGVALCECFHLTHFGCLVTNNLDTTFEEHHEFILQTITIVGCTLSFVGSLGIFLTGITLRSWRKKLGSKFLLHLTASIAFQTILTILTNFSEDFISIIADHKIACITIGGLMHYSVLAMFSWMLIIALFQLKRYVFVFNTFYMSHVLLKLGLLGWGLPAVPVIVVLVCDSTLYQTLEDMKPFCYPTGCALFYGVITPIAIIVVINIGIFIIVFINLNQIKPGCNRTNESKKRTLLLQLRLLVFLFFTLGLTWIFGLFSSIQAKSDLFLSYLFCTTGTLQGLVLFLYFIILDPIVRSSWIKFLKTKFSSHNN